MRITNTYFLLDIGTQYYEGSQIIKVHATTTQNGTNRYIKENWNKGNVHYEIISKEAFLKLRENSEL